MEVRIRLQKAGKIANKHYNYRIVAISRAAARQARHLEILGYYDPAKNPELLKVEHEKIEKWVAQGAQMSDTVRSLVKRSKKAK
ncbi:MAG: 30S ribosomal protein S16 [Candidatus Omnitrophota bacterium]|nr:30S ribosomal protein S16 [Candidatus Omnitrophota bacterium]MDZ4243288.1 30S ribosomal protein S16 [Candidatus Omnitrophota bacterium]